jgi:gentisate 1,2-dioxygenase
MEPGDVLLTPNWSTHGHGNDSTACAYWLDFLDAPLVQLLEPMFFEHEEENAHEAFEAEPEKPTMQPTTQSPFVFTLKDTLARLDAAPADPNGPFGTQVELGAPALDTTALYMMRLAPGQRTATHRTTASNIFAVVRGNGATTIDGERFEWTRGDVVTAPAWRPHFHQAVDDAILLRVTDEPVMKRLGFNRVEGRA